MNFWKLTVKTKEPGVAREMHLASDENQSKEKIKKDFLSANPKFSKVTLRKAKKPDGWVLFEKDFDKKVKEKEKKCLQQAKAS